MTWETWHWLRSSEAEESLPPDQFGGSAWFVSPTPARRTVDASTSMTLSCAWVLTPLTTPCKSCSTLGWSIHLRLQAGHAFERGLVVGLVVQGPFVFLHRLPPQAFALVN